MVTKTMADVTDKALDKADALVTMAADKAVDIFQAASNLIAESTSKYGPTVIDTVLNVVRVDHIQTLFLAYVGLAVMSVSIYKLVKWLNKPTNRDWDEAIPGILLFSLIFEVIVWNFCYVSKVLDVWEYVAVAKPELYLAKRTIDLVERKAESLAAGDCKK